MFIPTSEPDELPDIPILTSNNQYTDLVFGMIKIKYELKCLAFNPIAYLRRTFEPKAGGFIEGLQCGHCNLDPKILQGSQMIRQWVS